MENGVLATLVRPFTGLRPIPAQAAAVAAPPYDVLNTAEARERGITGHDLMTGSSARAYRWASEELKDHWDATPRPDLAQFEMEWFLSRGGL